MPLGLPAQRPDARTTPSSAKASAWHRSNVHAWCSTKRPHIIRLWPSTSETTRRSAGSRFVGKDRAESAESTCPDGRPASGNGPKAGGRSWTHLAQEILQRHVRRHIPARGSREYSRLRVSSGTAAMRPRRSRSIASTSSVAATAVQSRGSMPRAMYFATCGSRPVPRPIAETVIPCWCSSSVTISSANLTTHRRPRPIGGEVAPVRTLFRKARRSQHSACRPRIGMSVFQSPDLAEFTGGDSANCEPTSNISPEG